MWHFLNSNSGAVQATSAVIVALLTVVLARATVRYVRLTKQIAAASVAQAEAIHKPVLTLKQEEPKFLEIDMGKQITDATEGRQHTWVGPTLEIINIGTGPAIHAKWTLTRSHDIGGSIPYVAVGQCVSLRTASKVKMPAVATSFELTCHYTSLSGTKYVSRTRIENSREISGFEVSVES